MADSIVACPNCGRKYKVAEGSPAGEFQCTSCQTAVTYGETPVQAAPAVAKAVPARARPAPPGRGGPGRAGPGRGGPRGGRRPARGRGPGRGAPRGGRRGRAAGGYDDEEYGYAPPPPSNMGLYITLAVVGFLVVVGGVVILLTSGDDKPDHVAEQPKDNRTPAYVPPGTGGGVDSGGPAPGDPGGNTTGGTSGNAGDSGGGETDTIAPLPTDRPVRPESPPVRPDRPVAGNNPRSAPRGVSLGPIKAPPGDLYGVSAGVLRSMARKDLMSIIKDLKHYDDTPAALQAEIDKLCAIVCDLSSGGRAHKARDRLVKIGRPAMPRILSCWTKTGAWETDNGMTLACYMDSTLREITGGAVDSYMKELKRMSNPNKKTITDTATRWFVWWYTVGYSLDTYETESDDEDEDEGK